MSAAYPCDAYAWRDALNAGPCWRDPPLIITIIGCLPPESSRSGLVRNASISRPSWALKTNAATSAQWLCDQGDRADCVDVAQPDLLGHKTIADVAALVFKAHDGREIEAFLTKPAGLDAGGKHPMIVMIHGGPHGQQGPAFNHSAQAYASHGYAALMVNYRGSTGYGQAFSNAIARDQNGGEAKDVLSAVDAALTKYPWIDPSRLGVEGQSYGGQLTNWLVTQTDRFKAAVPGASISNLVSHNYMSVYHDYLEQEYGAKPHPGGVVDMLWERSAIRFANRVKTPVMLSTATTISW